MTILIAVAVMAASMFVTPRVQAGPEIDEARAEKLMRGFYMKYKRHFALVDGQFFFCAEYTGGENNAGLNPARNRTVSTTAVYEQTESAALNWPIRISLDRDEIFARCQAFDRLDRGQFGYLYSAQVKQVIDEDSMIIHKVHTVNPKTPWEYWHTYDDRTKLASNQLRRLKRDRRFRGLYSIYSERFKLGGRLMSLAELQGEIIHEQFKGRMELIRRHYKGKSFPDPHPNHRSWTDIQPTREALEAMALDTEILVDGVSTRGMREGDEWRMAQRTQLVFVDRGHAIGGAHFKRGLTLPQFEQMLKSRGITPIQFVEAHIDANKKFPEAAKAKEEVLDLLSRK